MIFTDQLLSKNGRLFINYIQSINIYNFLFFCDELQCFYDKRANVHQIIP